MNFKKNTSRETRFCTITHYHRSLFCIFGKNEMINGATVWIDLKTCFPINSNITAVPMLYTRTLTKNNLNIIIQHYHVLIPQWQSLLWDYARVTLT